MINYPYIMGNLSYKGLSPSSVQASNAGRGASKKEGTKPELLLRKALYKSGARPRNSRLFLPGNPDFVFNKAKVAVFCDGDFWHGHHWAQRRLRLEKGHNAEYWISKIKNNIRRDRENDRILRKTGWTVLRFWESRITRDVENVAEIVLRATEQKTAVE